MKTYLGAIVGTVVLASVPAQAAPAKAAPAAAAVDPASLAVAHQILTTAFPPEKRSQMFASMLQNLAAQMKRDMPASKLSDDKDLQTLLERSQERMFAEMNTALQDSLPDYFESMARAYARDFSLADLNSILAFAKTPTGGRFFERSTQIMKDPDVQAAGQRMTSKLLARLPEITRENMKDVEDYVAKKEKAEKGSKRAPVS